MITITEGKVSDKWEEAQELIALHADELSTNKKLMKLNPDKEKYLAFEKGGHIFSLFVYDDDKLVGYSVNALVNNLHYRELRMAQSDILFLHPDYRNERIGLTLIQKTEEVAKSYGAHIYLLNAKPGTPLADMLPHINYTIQDIVYSKVL